MASSLNAAVGGVILSSDASGALDIQANGTNAIQISSSASVVIGNLALTSLTVSGNTLLATSSGNVGVGTASPSKKLDVFNSGTTTTDFVVRNGTVSLLSFVDSGAAYTGVSTNHPFLLLTNNAERARLTTTGNLLVGTTTDVSGRSGVISDSVGDVRNIPSAGTTKTSPYTLAVTDNGEFVTVGSGGSVTVPNNTFVAGNAISVYNDTTGSVSINISTTTAYVVGTNTNRTGVTLATRGIANILFINPSYCILSGNLS